MSRTVIIRPGRERMKDGEAAKHTLAWQLLSLYGWKVEMEYPFALKYGRKFRFDLAYLWDYGRAFLAIEIDGGIWVRGAHSSPTDILRNMEKRNLATRLGWRVLSFTPDQVKSGHAARYIYETVTDQPPTEASWDPDCKTRKRARSGSSSRTKRQTWLDVIESSSVAASSRDRK